MSIAFAVLTTIFLTIWVGVLAMLGIVPAWWVAIPAIGLLTGVVIVVLTLVILLGILSIIVGVTEWLDR